MARIVTKVVLIGSLIVNASVMKSESLLNLKKMSSADVERQIREQLPIGSTREQVDAYLAANKIRHKMGWQPVPDGGGMTKLSDEHTEGALIVGIRKKRTLSSMVVRTDLKVQFKFDDKDLKLIDYIFREVYTGP
jgi:hypothetical protein